MSHVPFPLFSYTPHCYLPGKKSPFDSTLQEKWEAGMDKKGLFRYELRDPLPSKVLQGKYAFFLQLNPQRGQKRRPPQTISSLQQPFNDDEFHFNKVNDNEVIVRLKPYWVDPLDDNGDGDHVLLVNVSPLEYGHSLLVPFRSLQNPQLITPNGLRMALDVLLLSGDRNLRVGLNSLCAYASVNHEHYHVYYVQHRLYLETAAIKPIKTDGMSHLFELEDYPAKGFVFPLGGSRLVEDIPKVLEEVMKVVGILLEENIAHNLLMMRGDEEEVRIFLWGRESSFGAKHPEGFYPALCELGGHFPCKTEEAYNTLTEEEISEVLARLTGRVFEGVVRGRLCDIGGS